MLRIGILLDKLAAPVWVCEIIKEISQLPNIKIVVAAHGNLKNFEENQRPFQLFKKLDRILWPAQVDLSEEVKVQFPVDVPVLTCSTTTVDEKFFYGRTELKEIAHHNSDLLLYFGSKILAGEILTLSHAGVWSVFFGEIKRFCYAPPGLWEWFHKMPDTAVTLQRLTPGPLMGETIAKAITRTIYVSYTRNLCTILSKGIDLVVESVSKLAINGNFRIVNEATRNQYLARKPHRNIHENPGLYESLLACQKLITRAIPRVFTKLFFQEPWVLFFNVSGNDSPSLNFKQFTSLLPPKDRIWADPFVVSQDDKHYLFVEEMPIKTKKGHLTCLVLDKNGAIETSKIILEKPWHLSYPFIFIHEGTWYMMPESTENKTVDLYESVEFPFQWRFKRTLLSGVHAVDSTIHFSEGKYWLFCAVQNRLTSSPNDDLHIYYTDDLPEGMWIPHKNNPVISDPYNARPAGRIFFYNGVWCRPSQICVPDYGYGLALNRIVELNESSYKEERIVAELPHWRRRLLAMHTLNFTKEITFIDGILKRSRFF